MVAFLALLVPLAKIVATCVCVGAGCHVCKKGFEAYNKSQKVKLRNIERKSKADDAKIKAATEDNKRLEKDIGELKKEHEELAKQKEQDQKDLEFAKGKANDPNLSEEERRQWRLKVVELEDKLSRNDNESRIILNRIKELSDRVNKNNQTINSTGTGSGEVSDRHWIWDVLTPENILICLAIYAVWKIVRDEQR